MIEEDTVMSIDYNYEIMKYEVTDYEYVLFLMNIYVDVLIIIIQYLGTLYIR